MVGLVTVLLRAGLPVCDLRAAERGEEAAGVMLALHPGPVGAAVRSSGASTAPSSC